MGVSCPARLAEPAHAFSLPVGPAQGRARPLILPQQPRQLGDVGGDAPGRLSLARNGKAPAGGQPSQGLRIAR